MRSYGGRNGCCRHSFETDRVSAEGIAHLAIRRIAALAGLPAASAYSRKRQWRDVGQFSPSRIAPGAVERGGLDNENCGNSLGARRSYEHSRRTDQRTAYTN